MSIQTDVMIEQAGDDSFITAGQHSVTKKWHGVLYVNHPSPSGSPRWMPAYSDNRGWDTSKQATQEFIALDPEKLGKIKNVYEESD